MQKGDIRVPVSKDICSCILNPVSDYIINTYFYCNLTLDNSHLQWKTDDLINIALKPWNIKEALGIRFCFQGCLIISQDYQKLLVLLRFIFMTKKWTTNIKITLSLTIQMGIHKCGCKTTSSSSHVIWSPQNFISNHVNKFKNNLPQRCGAFKDFPWLIAFCTRE